MTTEASIFSIRPVTPGDYPTMKAWWEARGMEPWPESALPPDGVVVEKDGEPVCAGWLFLVERHHVAFFHGLVSRPRLGMSEAAAALRHLNEGLDIIMRRAGRTLMLGTVPPGAMLVHAKKLGFATLGHPVQSLVKVVYPSKS